MGGIGVEGNPAANALAREKRMLVLCVGTRLTDFATASRSLFSSDVEFVSVNVCDKDARKEGAVRLVADAKLALAALEEQAGHAGLKPNPAWRDRCEEVKSAWQVTRSNVLRAPEEGLLTQGQLIGILQEQAETGDTIVAAAGRPVGDLLKAWDATDGRRCHLEFGFSCMGYELPGALGVRMAQPDGAVVALIGDGTFVMQPSEIVTALQENLQVTLVISQNQGYQVIRRLQLRPRRPSLRQRISAPGRPTGHRGAHWRIPRARPRGGSERARGARVLGGIGRGSTERSGGCPPPSRPKRGCCPS